MGQPPAPLHRPPQYRSFLRAWGSHGCFETAEPARTHSPVTFGSCLSRARIPTQSRWTDFLQSQRSFTQDVPERMGISATPATKLNHASLTTTPQWRLGESRSPRPRRPERRRIKGSARMSAPSPPSHLRPVPRPGEWGEAAPLPQDPTAGVPGGRRGQGRARRRGYEPTIGTLAGTRTGRNGTARPPAAIFPQGAQTDKAQPHGRIPLSRRLGSRETAKSSGKGGGGEGR